MILVEHEIQASTATDFQQGHGLRQLIRDVPKGGQQRARFSRPGWCSRFAHANEIGQLTAMLETERLERGERALCRFRLCRERRKKARELRVRILEQQVLRSAGTIWPADYPGRDSAPMSSMSSSSALARDQRSEQRRGIAK